jgi:ketol-acid reductoisomerase
MPAFFTEADADPSALAGLAVALLGYSELGSAAAHNLRESGLTVIIGTNDTKQADAARMAGFEVTSAADAAVRSPILLLAEPDERLAALYFEQIAAGLRVGDMLVFLSGYCLAFGLIEPPPFVDTVLIAPRGSGAALRRAYQSGTRAPSFIAVEQDSSGKAWQRALALALALGALRGGALEVTAQQEAELRLFTQQTVLPALHHLLTTAAELLLREGYPPEASLLELYLSGELARLLDEGAQYGLLGALERTSQTAQYSVFSRLERFTDAKLIRLLENALDEIRSGKFAQEWSSEYLNGAPRLNALRTKRATLALWRHEARTRQMRDSAAPKNSD